MGKDLKLILAFYELSKKYAREIASGGGSNVLIAHATVAALPEPGDEPIAIALDKTIAELAAAEACAVEIAFSEDGVDATVTLDRNFSMAGDGNVQLGFATGAAVVELIGEQLMVSAQALGGEEAVMLMAFPVSSGDEPLILHGTLTSQT